MFTLLSNGRPGVRSSLSVQTQSPFASEMANAGIAARLPHEKDPSASTVSPNDLANHDVLDFIASDESLDRYDEVICASGWRLEAYRRNPVFQNAHQYGDILFTLGKALITEVRSHPRQAPDNLSTLSSQPSANNSPLSTFLYQRIQFATDVNPMARIAYGLYRGKFLNAVSVGFIPLRWQDAGSAGVSPAALPLSHPMGEGRGEGDPSLRTPPSEIRTPQPCRRKYLEQELLEVSAVGIPANPNALALAVKSGAVEKTDLRDTLELLRAICHPSSATRCTQEYLLSLARELRRILRRA